REAPRRSPRVITTTPPFEAFMQEQRGPVYRLLLAMVGPHGADDCFQETFLSALRAYPRLPAGSNVRGWVMTIATRKAFDHLRGPAAPEEAVGGLGMKELRMLRTAEVDDLSARAMAAFRDRAEEAGLVDVAYATIDSPLGELLVAGTRRGLVRISFPTEEHGLVVEELATTVSPRILEAPARL